jgi:hypothetical protein
MPAATTVGVLSQGGVGFPLVAAVGGTLLVTALGLAVRALRPPRAVLLAGGCLLGAVGVLAQLLLTAGDTASRAGFLLGLVGASAWYGAGVRLLADRVTGAGRQWLAVGSLLWVGGTVTVTATAAPADWPLVWSLLLGLGLLALAVLVWLMEPAGLREWDREMAVLSGAFLAPSVLGGLAGEEILFVAYVLAFATSLVCWSLVRLALRQSP